MTPTENRELTFLLGLILISLLLLFLPGCMSPTTTLEIYKDGKPSVRFSHPKDVSVEALEADLNKGTLSIINLQSTASSVIKEQAGREQLVGDLIVQGIAGAMGAPR